MGVLSDFGLWLWRLLPGNPILVRVVSAAGKRLRHQYARAAYLAALCTVLVVMSANAATTQTASLAELAKQSTQTFLYVSLVQLFLTSFIAPVFAAGAITQEKDANTFHILLTTPLSAAQIVIGSLFSRIYFVWALLLSGLPVFAITMIYGGVTLREVVMSLLLAACTGLVTGALAITIGIVKVGTRRTIFSFFLGVAVYLLAIGALGLSGYTAVAEAPLSVGLASQQMSWLAPFHPFLALLVVTGQTPAPNASEVAHYGWPWSWMLAQPHIAYMWITTLVSALLVFFALFFVRRGARDVEIGWWTQFKKRFLPDGEKKQKPRRVWNNPIAWREAKTRASAGGRSALRWFFIVICIAGGIVLITAHHKSWWTLTPTAPDVTRSWLTSIIWIELAVILLTVTNTAATTLTREKESMTMELLLSTPLTSKYIIAGMLRGLVSFVMPLIAAPTATLLIVMLVDLVQPTSDLTTPEAVLVVPLSITAFTALSAMIGLHFSLHCKKTVQAVMSSTGVVMGVAGFLTLCMIGFGAGGAVFAAALGPLSPFLSMAALVDYQGLYRHRLDTPTPEDLAMVRMLRFASSLVAIAIYAAITYVLYNNLVRNFDMIVRRQSA